jgi:hypothetical protein
MSRRRSTLRKLQGAVVFHPNRVDTIEELAAPGAGGTGGNPKTAELRGEFLILSPVFTVFSPCSCPI